MNNRVHEPQPDNKARIEQFLNYTGLKYNISEKSVTRIKLFNSSVASSGPAPLKQLAMPQRVEESPAELNNDYVNIEIEEASDLSEDSHDNLVIW